MLDLEYVQLNVTKVLALFNKVSWMSLSNVTQLIDSCLQNVDERVRGAHWTRVRGKRGVKGTSIAIPIFVLI
jgi:hypothetical protein